MSDQYQHARQESFGTGRFKRVRRIRDTIAANKLEYGLLLPVVLLITVVLWIPFIRGIWMSFHEWPAFGEPTWVGLDNYTYLLNWDVFYTSLRATFLYGSAIIVQLILAVVTAMAVKHQHRFRSIVASAVLLPFTLPAVVTGTLWLYLLNPNFGPFFGYLNEWGIIEQTIYWSADGTLALAVISWVSIWSFWPFMFIIILASLENIDDTYYEAAKIYKANRLQMFFKITYPQIKSSILVALVLRLIWNLSKVSQPLQMTGGGPGYETSLLAILLYNNASTAGQYGLAYAIGIFLLLGTFVLIVTFIIEFERSTGDI